MSDPAFNLAEALRTRLAVIADREGYVRDPAGHLDRLKRASAQIEAAVELLPKPADPQLTHYLQRHSYDKALAWLDQCRVSGS